MDIVKELSDSGLNLGNEILYNLLNATSRLMRDDGITRWRGPQEEHSLFPQALIDVLSEPKDIVAYLIDFTNINHNVLLWDFF